MSKNIFISLICILLFSLLLFSCESNNKINPGVDKNMSNKILVADWQKLSMRKIYFGHQSVGYNIIEGLNTNLAKHPEIQLRLIETSDLNAFDSPVFAHSQIGRNENPYSKIDEFVSRMDAGLGNRADIAFFKLCYVDITADSKPDKIFSYYADKMQYLKNKYPKTIFIHVTAPLTTVQTGPKSWIKKLIGRSPDGYADNIKRNEFNDLLRRRYSGKEPVFDLAKTESRLPNGSSSVFSVNEATFECLPFEYTTDGGHLNQKGSQTVAFQLLEFLARLPN